MVKVPANVLALATGTEFDVTQDPAWETFGSATRAAIALAQAGIRVFPCHEIKDGHCTCRDRETCKSAGKHPRTKRGVDQATTTLFGPNGVVTQARAFPTANWGQALDDRVVVDVDVAGGKQGWSTLDAALRKHGTTREDALGTGGALYTQRIRTGRGGSQFVYVLPAGVKSATIPDKFGLHVDIKRGSGHYVMVPGSVTDSAYELEADLPLVVLPNWVIEDARKNQAAAKARQTKEAKAAGSPSGRGLSALLALPPDSPEKGNSWMTAVLGYLVAGVRREEDVAALARLVSTSGMNDPMAEADLIKVTRSVLRQEERNHPSAAASEEDGLVSRRRGYLRLAADGNSLEMLTSEGDMEIVHQYLDCGVTPVMIVDEGDRRFYRLAVRGHLHRGTKYVTVESSVLADARTRTRAFANLGYTFDIPAHPLFPLRDDSRLIAYLETCGAPVGQAANALGWDGDEFLTPEGIIAPDGLATFRGRIPSPRVADQAMCSYGMHLGDEEVIDILREVYTFQEPQVAAVAMAWWAMCLLKGRYQSSIAPILYVDASSGSGKTNGFFAFLVALAGNLGGSGSITVARLRHQLSVNLNGIVWVDDMANLRGLDETLRQAASRGTHTKTNTLTNDGTITQHMVGNVLLSCEGVDDMLSEKAMRDRVIRLEVRPVSDRRSLKGDYPQWDDITAMITRYRSYGEPGETYAGLARAAAGSVVRYLAGVPVPDLSAYTRGRGRHGEKHAILRVGAKILAEWLDLPEILQHVEAWCSGERDLGAKNLFFNAILPWLVDRHCSEAPWVELPNGTTGPAAVFIEHDTLYVNPAVAAELWISRRNSDDRDRQLGNKAAILRELAEMGVSMRGSQSVRKVGGRSVRFYRLAEEVSRQYVHGPQDTQETLS